MYTYSFSDEDTEEISKKSQADSDLEKLFSDVDAKYDLSTINKSDYEKTLDLQKQEFSGLTDEEIQKKAESSLQEYSNETKDSIDNDYAKNSEAIDSDLEKLQKTTDESKESLQSTYKQVKVDAENDAIKRGLARSSIIVNKLAKFDSSMLSQFAEIEKDYLETTNKLTSQKSLLEVQKQNALDSFDITYAVKLSEKISSIAEELQEKEKQVIEYNNKVDQLEKEYEAEMLEQYASDLSQAKNDNLDYLEFVNKYGETGISTLKAKEKFDLAYKHLMSMSKNDALKELSSNSIYQDQLLSNYSALLSKMQAREN